LTRSDDRSPSWCVRVTSSERHRADVHVRRHRFAVGKPVEFDVDSPSVSSLEYLLGALGADLVNGFRGVARRRRVDAERVEATVEGRLDNPLVHLAVVGESGHPGLAYARVKLYVSSLEAEDRLREVWKETLERSPIVCTLRDRVPLELSLQVVV
jgi:hypothetical protein